MKKQARSVYFFVFFSLFCALLFLAPRVSDGVRRDVDTLFSSLFPTLFPFLFFGMLLSRLADGVKAPRAIDYVFRKLFALPGDAWYVFFVGFLCGFPSGALATQHAQKSGIITRAEARRLHYVILCPSPAFCISFIGGTVLENTAKGVLIYLSGVMTALFFAFIGSKFAPKVTETARKVTEKTDDFSLIFTFFDAAGSAVRAFLTLAVYYVIFHALWVIPEGVLRFYNVNNSLCVVLFGLFDSAGACAELGAISGDGKALLATLILSLHGLNVYCQCLTAHRTADVKFCRFFAFRLVFAAFSCLFVSFFLNFL